MASDDYLMLCTHMFLAATLGAGASMFFFAAGFPSAFTVILAAMIGGGLFLWFRRLVHD